MSNSSSLDRVGWGGLSLETFEMKEESIGVGVHQLFRFFGLFSSLTRLSTMRAGRKYTCWGTDY